MMDSRGVPRRRITSTCVENTCLIRSLQQSCQDHLHMCGEYMLLRTCRRKKLGSPPHSWRIPTVAVENNSSGGITSTLVENTSQYQEQFLQNQDHLHTRGEYFTIDVVRPTNVGSPPHSWRILDLKVASHACTGITSTLVENTQSKKITQRI